MSTRGVPYGWTPLYWAARFNTDAAALTAAVEALVAAGADVNSTDWLGLTPLHMAVCFNPDAAAVTAAVEVLVAAGADVRAKSDTGAEPLHLAVGQGNGVEAQAAAVQALLASGADAQAKNRNGDTPLPYALDSKNSQTAEDLLAAMPTDAALEDLCGFASPFARQMLSSFVASRLPLTDAQWALISITPAPGLARTLPAALACSVNQARQLVWCLPPPDAQRLCTAALCLAHVQRGMPLWPQQHLPLAIVERILCSAVDDS